MKRKHIYLLILILISLVLTTCIANPQGISSEGELEKFLNTLERSIHFNDLAAYKRLFNDKIFFSNNSTAKSDYVLDYFNKFANKSFEISKYEIFYSTTRNKAIIRSLYYSESVENIISGRLDLDLELVGSNWTIIDFEYTSSL